jgi:transcriptional regulator
MDRAHFSKLTGAITGFEMRIAAWRPTVKLSQNKDADARKRIAAGIERTGHGALAHMMRALGEAGESA